MYKIYTLSFLESPFYVGMTTNINSRFEAHLSCIKENSAFAFLRSKVSIDVVDETDSRMKSIYLEEYWIHQFISWGFCIQNKWKRPKMKKVSKCSRRSFTYFSKEELAFIDRERKRGDIIKLAKLMDVSEESVRRWVHNISPLNIDYKNFIISYYQPV